MFFAKNLDGVVLSLAGLIFVGENSLELVGNGRQVTDNGGLVLVDFGEVSSLVGLEFLVDGLEIR